MARPPDPGAPDGEPWPDEPDAFEAADRRWSEKWADEPPEDEEEPVAELRGPLPPAPDVATAYHAGMREAGPYLGLGLQIAGTMALFVGLGYGLDRAAGTSPWGVVAGAALAMVAVVALVVRIANQANAEAQRKRAARGDGPPGAGRTGARPRGAGRA